MQVFTGSSTCLSRDSSDNEGQVIDDGKNVLYHYIHQSCMEGAVFDLGAITGFDWDEGNREKNWIKHGVDYRECEEVFFNRPLIVGDEIKHSVQEKRYFVLGRSNAGKRLFLAITIRKDKVRVISARHQSRKERQIYEQQS